MIHLFENLTGKLVKCRKSGKYASIELSLKAMGFNIISKIEVEQMSYKIKSEKGFN